MPSGYLVYNPNAGRLPPGRFIRGAANLLRRKGWEIQVFPTRNRDHLSQLAAQAAQTGQEAMFLAGGDGSLGRTLKGLAYSNTALGVLPAGTANVWAKELNLPVLTPFSLNALTRSARMLSYGHRRAMDIGYCAGDPFLLWVGIGLDALVVKEMETRRSRLLRYIAPFQYALKALRLIRQWKGLKLNIQTEKETVSGHFMMALVCNIPKYAGGYLNLSANTILDDGVMDLWLFYGNRMRDVLRFAWTIFRGQQFETSTLLRLPFRKLQVSSDEALIMHADGDPLPSQNRVTLEVGHRALQILTPQVSRPELFSAALRPAK